MTEAQQRLAAFLESRRDTPWAWGTHDCLQFAAGAVAALTGRDYAQQFGVYRSRLGAYRILADYADLSEFITHLLGRPQKPLAHVRFGDVVTLYGPDGETAGIAAESHCFFAGAPKGVVSYRLPAIRHCWQV